MPDPIKISTLDLVTPADADVMPIYDASGATPADRTKGVLLSVLKTWIGALTNPMTTAGDLIVGGASGAPARLAKGTDAQVLKIISGVLTWAAEAGGGIQHTLDAVDPPDVDDDEGMGYSGGSLYSDGTDAWLCLDPSEGAAVWLQLTGGGGSDGPLNNFAATTDPGVGDDSGDGYGVGSTWINLTLDRIWRCADASTGAAAWERVDQDPGILNNYTATTDPGVGDDGADGYAVGSRWVNVTLDRIFECLDATNGAAVWSRTNEGGGGSSLPVVDTTALVSDPSDSTKRVRLDAGQVATGQTRAIQAPNGDSRVRDILRIPVLGSTTTLELGTYWLGNVPANFTIEEVCAVTYDSTGTLETPGIIFKIDSSPLLSIGVGTGMTSGNGKYGSALTGVTVGPGNVLTVEIENTGSGSAGSAAQGLIISIIGFWSPL